MNRRDMISTTLKGAALLGIASIPGVGFAKSASPYTLAPLPYAYDALEPHIDALTMQIHHSRHHQAFITNLNRALEGSALLGIPVESLLTRLNEVPDAIRQTVRNNAGGHANHAFFWSVLAPASSDRGDGSRFEPFKAEFERAAMGVFGSGWAWIVVNADKNLEVMTTPNQDSPLTAGKTPVLGLDVWEHAYYLKYQNMRANYVREFWNVVNWSAVEAHYQNTMG